MRILGENFYLCTQQHPRASAENFLRRGAIQDVIKIDIGIALLEMQLVEKNRQYTRARACNVHYCTILALNPSCGKKIETIFFNMTVTTMIHYCT